MKNYSADQLIARLEKECTSTKGYLGVDTTNLSGETEKEKIESLFFYIAIEIDYLTYTGHEETIEYGDDKPFKSEYYVNLHIKRLEKFLKKYDQIVWQTKSKMLQLI